MSKLQALLDTIKAEADKVAVGIKEKKADTVVERSADLRRAITRAKSTTGVTLAAREMALSNTKLDECIMWSRHKGWDTAARRLSECVMWAEEGINNDQRPAA